MLDQIFKNIEASEKDIVKMLSEMIRVQSYSPALGGQGESKRAEFLAPLLKGFDEVKIWNYDDKDFPGIKRSSVTAKKYGKRKETLWIISHIDTVAPGDENDWKIPPFEGRVEDGKVHGRGSEDDGEAVVASIFAANLFADTKFDGMSLGIALVADEELGSKYGIEKLIEEGIFSNDDLVFVPDHASIDNDKIETVEKSIVWPTIIITGKSAHASLPHCGINPIPLMMDIARDIKDLEKKYDAVDDRFEEPKTTMEFTRIVAPTAGTNAIPTKAEFSFDCRVLPCYPPENLKNDIEAIVEKYRKTTKAKIDTDYYVVDTGKQSSENTLLYLSLKSALEIVLNKKNVRPEGSCGATCALSFRQRGINSYAWVMYNNTIHQTNEFVPIEHLVIDTKVFAKLIYDLCVNSQKDD